ncbi:MAG TPA: succinylglutamate desuccinylase, partial [Candidatus Angelobacter sp.]|nr:succinylglutamate desuccinylase [Candidatus Angelobacter sp.]
MKPTKIICLFLLIVFCCAMLTAQSNFTVGTATAAPGQKATGILEVPAGVDAGSSIPVAVFQGTKPGPVLALASGAHGTEYASI